MNISEPCIRRPVATTLLTLALALAGGISYFLLPVSPLPQVEFPTIQVQAALPGASPETMASAVATPLERQFGRIAGVTEMTSASSLGSATIVLQFDLGRNIDAAARDVQAAINAASGQLPTNLPNRPNYRKVNPADAPVMILALKSDTYDRARMYDAASSILQQKLAQVEGVGQVTIGGGALPAVRVELNPTILNSLGLGLDDVRQALGTANANRPKGQLSDSRRSWSLATTDQLFAARDYRPLIVSWRNGAPVRLADVARVTDSVEDLRTGGLADGEPAVLLVVFRQPGANIIETVDRVRDLLPQLAASIPAGINLSVVLDRTTTIRASVRDVEHTLVLSIGLVVLVVFLFLRDWRATLIPSVVVPISLVGTFGVMYLAGHSIDNLSLMALTIATGFVVDDAIVVIENITRYHEQGLSPFDAAVRGAREIGFTVVSISVSLVAVFIPILLMGGIVGRLFREFAVTLSVAILVSMVVSLTTTPMMCARILRSRRADEHGWLWRVSERGFALVLRLYERALDLVLRHTIVTMAVFIATVGLTVWLYAIVPKGFFPQQDTGRLTGSVIGDQNTSSAAMQDILRDLSAVLRSDPAVNNVIVFSGGGGGGTANTARMFVTLKPLAERKLSADLVIARVRGKLSSTAGATLFLQAVQDLRIGGRPSSSQYQYTVQSDDLHSLNTWAPQILASLKTIPGVIDATSDQQNRGLEVELGYDRDTAARLGITSRNLDDALYDAFGQRQVSTIYTPLNQYHVVMEIDPQLSSSPDGLDLVRVRPAGVGTPAPLSVLSQREISATPLAVNHQSQFPSITFSFNLVPGTSLGDAVDGVQRAGHEIGLPSDIRGKFSGTAQAFQESLDNEPWLIAAAIVTVYIVLGMLYESLIHPVTILSTLPSAGVGALLALLLCHAELNVIALIGIILLIGIVKKNAIMMIDFAIEAERAHGKTPAAAIREACLLRFRPITMTTMAALLGGLPLAIGGGVGSEMRQPLGIAIVGGLIFSQALTLFTTPVVYLFLERLRRGRRGRPSAAMRALGGTTVLVLALISLGGCTTGPEYSRPEVETPERFASTRPGEEREPEIRPDWWTFFQDDELNALEAAAIEHNQDLQAAAARVLEARAAARSVDSAFWPVISVDPSISRTRPAGRPGSSGASSVMTTTTRQLPFDVSYEVDLWGKVRRASEGAVALTEAASDALAVVQQTLTADVAQNVFTLRALDAQDAVLVRTIASYSHEIELTQTKLRSGLASPVDVLQAETQLDAAQGQLIDIRRQRADAQHALAILLGRPPGAITVATKPLDLPIPTVPAGLPSTMLAHRPDVAGAEHNLVAANADIGVAEANLYPSLKLTGSAGFESIASANLFDWASRVWTLGASLTAPLFEGGRLDAAVEAARARHQELTAVFRQTVLVAFGEVEDSLTDLHARAEAATVQQHAIESSREALRLIEMQYRNGLVGYLPVIDAQRTLLANELSAVQLHNQRLASTVLLIKALGGGWAPRPAALDSRPVDPD